MSNLIDDVLANPLVGAAATAVAVGGVALWIAGAWWAWRDASRRTESMTVAFLASAWIIISTPMLLPLSLAIYAVARPAITAAEDRTQALVAALSATNAVGTTCPWCDTRIDPAWARCPQCATWLLAPCSSCGEWSPADLEICPYCAHEGHAVPAVELAEEGAAARAARRAARPRIGRRTPGTVAGRPALEDRVSASLGAAVARSGEVGA
jgi:hypothetical protein